jgi:hypothetical protein
MTKKELQATMVLISAVRSASAEIKSYCRDFDSSTLKSVSEDLDNAVKSFRKEAKL